MCFAHDGTSKLSSGDTCQSASGTVEKSLASIIRDFHLVRPALGTDGRLVVG